MEQARDGLALVLHPHSPKRTARVRGASLTDQVYERIREDIIHGHLVPGVRLVEMEIAQQMGTSQGPVREALQRLEHEGLVDRHARSATYVTQISLEDMHDIFSIRSMVEGCAIRQTAQRMTHVRYEALQSLVDRMRRAGQRNDIASLVNYDMEFHRNLCIWSENPTLLRVWTPLVSQTERFVVQMHPRYFADLVEVADAHVPVLDALCRGLIEGAETAIREHIMLVWSRIRQ
ncbi:MAG: hypothetical protein DCC55_14835 [Chloroflexi bacterium]|nr:MAG: hypothetical protein DCC55_14835 [Chloroflexota bacterium]